MTPELDKQLCEKYPKIFKNRYADMRTTAMCWGFECGSGWFNIIDKLCSNIQGHINYSRKERVSALRYNRALKRALNGDVPALERHYTYNPKSDISIKWAKDRTAADIAKPDFKKVPEIVPQVIAEQVKEKFGGLRFYYYGGDEYIEGLAAMAESMSYVTCENCGKPGKPNNDGWIKTSCEEHK